MLLLLPLLLEQAKTSEAVSAKSGSEQINSPADKQQKFLFISLKPDRSIQSIFFSYTLTGLDIKLRVMSVTIGMLVIIIMVEVKMMMIAGVAAEKGDADGGNDKLFTDAILHKLMADAAQTS